MAVGCGLVVMSSNNEWGPVINTQSGCVAIAINIAIDIISTLETAVFPSETRGGKGRDLC